MTIIRIEKDKANPYVMISKEPLQNATLTWKAKGLLSYLLSLPDDWKINITDLQNRAKDGRDSVANTINELIAAGYIIREKARATGKFDGYDYVVYEKPPYPEKPYTDKPFTENPQQVITHNTNNTSKDTKVSINGVPLPLKSLQIEYNEILTRTIKNIAGFKTNLLKDSKVMRSVYQSLSELQHNQFFKDKDFSDSMKKGKMLYDMDATRIEKIFGDKKKLENILKKASREWVARRSDRKQFFIPDKNPALSDFFYNAENKNSWFLHCACCEPMVRSGFKQDKILHNLIRSLEKSVPDLQKLTNKIYNKDVIKEWDDQEKVQFYSCIKGLLEWREENRVVLSEQNEGWRTHFGGPTLMFRTVGYFLDEFFPQPMPTFLSVGRKNWKQFVAYCANSYDVKLRIKS